MKLAFSAIFALWAAAPAFAAHTEPAAAPSNLAAATLAHHSPLGRWLLKRRAFDTAQPAEVRVAALRHLSNRDNLWPPDQEGIDEKEQHDLIDRCLKAVAEQVISVRGEALTAIFTLSYVRDGKHNHLSTDRACPALTKTYHNEPPGDFRDSLAYHLRELGGHELWKEISGNSGGTLLVLTRWVAGDKEIAGDLAANWVDEPVDETPTLVLERVGKNGAVIETHRHAFPLENDQPWPPSWKGHPHLPFSIATNQLKPGRWRLIVQGVMGKAKTKWSSEPRQFDVADEPKKNEHQKQADAAAFKLDESANALRCLLAYDGKLQLSIHKLAFGNLAIEFKNDQGKGIYRFDGHYRTQFEVIDDVVYFTDYNPHATGCTLVAFDLKNKKQLWECSLKGLGPIDHTKYHNSVSMSFQGDAIWIFAKESSGRYVEIVDRKTGNTVANRVYKDKE